jgi:hypothetical protein
MFYENKKDGKDISEWNSAVTQDHTHSAFHEYNVPEDVGERAVCQKLQFLYDVLEDRLNADQVKPLPHTYGENYSINTVYHEMKKHALALPRTNYHMVHCCNTSRQYKSQESGVVFYSMWCYIGMCKSRHVCG